MSESIGSRLARGALLQLSAALPGKILSIVLTWLATHRMSPALYGELSLALIIYGVSDLLTNPGIFTYFVRTRDVTRDALDSAWTLNVVRGFALTLLFWVIAPAMSWALDGTERVTLLLQLLSVSFAIIGVRNLHVVEIYHAQDFKKIAILDASGATLGTIIAIALLLATGSPAALAVGTLFTALFSCLMTWRYASRPPRWMYDGATLEGAWRFVRYMFLNNIIIYLLQRIDDLLIGKVGGPAPLGIYSFTYNVANNSVLFLTNTLRQVLLPALVTLVADPPALRDAVLRAVSGLANVSWVACTVMVVIAPELCALLLPAGEWGGAAVVLQALMPFVLVRAVNGVFGSLMMAAGKPEVLTRASGAQLLLLAPAVLGGYKLGGLVGASLAIAALNYLAGLALTTAAQRLFDLSAWRVAALTWAGLPAALLVGALAWQSKALVGSPLARLGLSGAVCCAGLLLVWEVAARLAGEGVLSRPSWLLRRKARKP